MDKRLERLVREKLSPSKCPRCKNKAGIIQFIVHKKIVKKVFTLGWSRNLIRLRQETQVDGIFPLLCTDHSLSATEVLQAYKYQPRLEKRFNQLKQIHNGAPLLFKKLERIEATMFAFFIALMIQALIERQVRHQMANHEIPAIALYPKDHDANHPTTTKIIKISMKTK